MLGKENNINTIANNINMISKYYGFCYPCQRIVKINIVSEHDLYLYDWDELEGLGKVLVTIGRTAAKG